MTESHNIRDYLIRSFKEGSDFYVFHVDPLIRKQKDLSPRHRYFNEYTELLKKGTDLSTDGELAQFLYATNDEKRNYLADDYTDFLLFRVDMKDANYFRRGVSLREMSRDIDYERHRDHAAHTLFNYLLGWIFYQQTTIRDEIDAVIRRVKSKTYTLTSESDSNFFGMMWCYVSLFHDIGYLFEGTLPAGSLDESNERIKRGTSWVSNFFLHRFWFDAEIDSISIKKILYKYLDIEPIDFDNVKSMIALGDILTSLYNINEIKKSVDKINANFFPDDLRRTNFNYWDSFKIWEIFYENFFGKTPHFERIKILKKAYYENMYKGNEESGLRNIDHGISSGLLMLLYSSYYNSIFFNLRNINASHEELSLKLDEATRSEWFEIFKNDGTYYTKPGDTFGEEMVVFERISNFIFESSYPHFEYHSEWFFTGILWATSAAAIHNIQQEQPSKWFDSIRSDDHLGLLYIEDDPLAYLGILVDIIQQWDRHRVFPNPALIRKIPVQSKDVSVAIEDSRLIVKYSNAQFSKSVQDDLNKSLKNWDAFVSIES